MAAGARVSPLERHPERAGPRSTSAAPGAGHKTAAAHPGGADEAPARRLTPSGRRRGRPRVVLTGRSMDPKQSGDPLWHPLQVPLAGSLRERAAGGPGWRHRRPGSRPKVAIEPTPGEEAPPLSMPWLRMHHQYST